VNYLKIATFLIFMFVPAGYLILTGSWWIIAGLLWVPAFLAGVYIYYKIWAEK
jgi:hypothetical protein